VDRITGEFVYDNDEHEVYEVQFVGFKRKKDRSWIGEREARKTMPKKVVEWEKMKHTEKKRFEHIKTTKKDKNGEDQKGTWINFIK